MRLFVFTLLFIAAFTLPSFALAEYRAFQLEIEDTETGGSRTVITTLDHFQYSRYHPTRPTEIVRYITSWMCYENTGSGRKPCEKADP